MKCIKDMIIKYQNGFPEKVINIKAKISNPINNKYLLDLMNCGYIRGKHR
jgi:hypothetical protein